MFKTEEILAFSKEYLVTEGYKEGVIDVLFISNWDNGYEIITPAQYNIDENRVFDIALGECIDDEGDEVEILNDEYIELPNGTRLLVYETAAEYEVVGIVKPHLV